MRSPAEKVRAQAGRTQGTERRTRVSEEADDDAAGQAERGCPRQPEEADRKQAEALRSRRAGCAGRIRQPATGDRQPNPAEDGPADREVFADNGFGIIVDTSKPWPQSNVLWWGEAVDITKPVIDAYNVQSGVPAPANPAAREADCVRRLRAREPRRRSRQHPRLLNLRNNSTDTSGVLKVPEGRVPYAAFFYCVSTSARAIAVSITANRIQRWRTPCLPTACCETSWTQRGRRSWTTLTSFGLQAVAIGMLLTIPLLTTVGLPRARTVSTPISLGRVGSRTRQGPWNNSAVQS